VAHQLEDHGTVISFNSEPVYFRDSSSTLKYFVKFTFVFELRDTRLNGLKLDGYCLVSASVFALVNLSESSASNFLNELVILAYSKVHSIFKL
jgi:hypothetical protein